jgi:redox-sensitive bicupin YhaK (pirin superfamily)
MSDDVVIDVIDGRPRDIGGFSVRRVLPSPHRRHVGPFVFWDHMGPVALPPGEGMDVLPHPHIGLATVTFLFEGEIVHRDSVGSHQAIRPGDVNWMTAGRGIVHSERTDPAVKARGARVHGIQSWVALPAEHEGSEPHFAHHPGKDLPVVTEPGATLRVIAGEAYGAQSPARTLSPLFYVDATLETGASVELPDHEERAVYVLDGSVEIDGASITPGRLAVLAPKARVTIRAPGATHAMFLGGAPLGDRHMYWNFVSSDRERIERAKADWRDRRFPLVPGDEEEFVPLPAEGPHR